MLANSWETRLQRLIGMGKQAEENVSTQWAPWRHIALISGDEAFPRKLGGFDGKVTYLINNTNLSY